MPCSIRNKLIHVEEDWLDLDIVGQCASFRHSILGKRPSLADLSTDDAPYCSREHVVMLSEPLYLSSRAHQRLPSRLISWPQSLGIMDSGVHSESPLSG